MPSSIGRTNKAGRWSDSGSSTQIPVSGVEPYAIGQRTLSIAVGNLVDCPTEGLVCYASSSLALHSVVASKLVEVGGSSIRTECAKHLPTEIGNAVVLSAGKLPARYILVAVTNHIKSAPTIANIRTSIQSVMQQAGQLGLRSIALPTIRVSKQISPDDALLATLAPLVDHLSGRTSVEHAVLVIDDLDDFPLLSQYLPACLDRLSAVGPLRAAAQAMKEAEDALRQSQMLLEPLNGWGSANVLTGLIQQQLALRQDVLELLLEQQHDIGPRWQASHQAEIELAQSEVNRLGDLLYSPESVTVLERSS